MTEASDARAGLVDNLICEWDLNECEAGDLGSLGEVLGVGNHYDLDDDGFMAHMEMRAEVLKMCGSPMQEMYDEFEKLGHERRDMGNPRNLGYQGTDNVCRQCHKRYDQADNDDSGLCWMCKRDQEETPA